MDRVLVETAEGACRDAMACSSCWQPGSTTCCSHLSRVIADAPTNEFKTAGPSTTACDTHC